VVRFHERAIHSAAWEGHRSFSGAGEWVQLVQIGASQVPDRRAFTFQSQSSAARRPHWMQRFAFSLVQMMAWPPDANGTW
jgi:hypothetical protein